MIKKRISLICAVVCVVAMLFSLTACGGSNKTASGDQKVTISFLHKWSNATIEPFFKQAIKDFEKQNPNITVKYNVSTDEAIKDKLRLMAGNGNLPDVTFCWTGDFLYKFIRAGYVKDITSYENDTAWKDSIYTSALEPYVKNSKLYGVPLRIDGKFFLYNKDTFAKYNLKAPTTWDEFLSVCQTLKDNGVTPIQFGNQLPWAGIHYLTSLNERMVPTDTLKTDNDVTSGSFKDSGYVAALNNFKLLNDKGYFSKAINSTSHDIASTTFESGKGGMLYVETEEFKDDVSKSKFNVGIFPFPTMKDGKGDQSYLTGAPDGFVVSAKTKYPAQCEKLLKFFTSKDEQAAMVKQLSWTPAVKGAMTADNAATKQSYEAMQYIESAKGFAQWMDTELYSNIANVYLNESQGLFNGTKTADQIMADVQKAAASAKTEVASSK